MSAKVFRLSKSQYCKAQKCQKALWLYRHQPDLADEPSAFQKNIFAQGKEVGALATKLFPAGVLITEDHTQSKQALERTRSVMSSGAPEAIFEAAFEYQNVLIRVDILKNNNDGSWDLIEVKSTNGVEPKAHYDDVAIQKWVLENCGIKIRDSVLLHLNRDYSREGDLDLQKLFAFENIGQHIGPLLAEIPKKLEVIQENLNAANPPTIEIGTRCNNPYECEFRSHCWSHVSHGSIHTLGRISERKRVELVESGIERILDIPEDFELTPNQIVEMKSFKENGAQIELSKIRDYISRLSYPLYFLDYESVAYAVPQFDGNWPHKHLTTQYSLHKIDRPGGNLMHKSYLHDSESDPSESLAKSLLEDIRDDGGSIIVYHQTYEKERTVELADAFPEMANQLFSLVDRMWDLEVPFAKRWYWDKKFDGSSSIKNVLPIFRPEFSYDDLEIKKGDVAQLRYAEMIKMPAGKHRQAVREALLKYCERDTKAMVVILAELMRIVMPESGKIAV